MKGFYTQGLVVLFSETPDLGVIRMIVERQGFHVRSVEDASDWKEMQGDSLMIDWRPDANGCCVLGDPQESPQLFSAWTMGAFGPHTHPGALERAKTYGCSDADVQAASGHSSFARVRISYVFGAENDAPIRPSDHDSRAELDWLFHLCRVLLEVPGAVLYFNPNGEVLKPGGLRCAI